MNQNSKSLPETCVHGPSEGLAVFLATALIFLITAQYLGKLSNIDENSLFLLSATAALFSFAILSYLRLHLPGLSLKFDSNPKSTKMKLSVSHGFKQLFSIRYTLADNFDTQNRQKPYDIKKLFAEQVTAHVERISCVKTIHVYGLTKADAEIFARIVRDALLKQ